MIEIIVREALEAELDVPVLLEAPEDKPVSYIVLEKTGSSRRNQLDHATMAVQSIADTLYDAAALNEQAKAIMNRLPELSAAVFSARLDSDYNFTDTESKTRRYQAVYNITYKE